MSTWVLAPCRRQTLTLSDFVASTRPSPNILVLMPQHRQRLPSLTDLSPGVANGWCHPVGILTHTHRPHHHTHTRVNDNHSRHIVIHTYSWQLITLSALVASSRALAQYSRAHATVYATTPIANRSQCRCSQRLVPSRRHPQPYASSSSSSHTYTYTCVNDSRSRHIVVRNYSGQRLTLSALVAWTRALAQYRGAHAAS